jgi:hypothetical protein
LHVDAALAVFQIGISIATVITSIEFAAHRRLVSRGGIWDWRVLRTRTRFTFRIPSVERTTTQGRTWVLGCALRAFAGILALPVPGPSALQAGALLAICVLTVGMMYRLMFGLDGSDQLVALLSLAGALALFVDTVAAKELFCWFTTAIVCVSYVTAGAAKATSPIWRSGRALGVIMRTDSYGAGRWITLSDGALGRLGTRLVILVELAFPLSLIGWPWLTVPLVTAMTGFHGATAVVMGLNGFLPAYVSTFGCVIWCATAVAAL